MSRAFLTPIGAVRLTTNPGSGTAGDIYYNTADNTLRYYNGTSWSIVASGNFLTSNQTITLSGDASGSGSTAITVTLANSGVTAGTYNNVATEVRPFTVDAKGRITAIGNAVTIAPAFSSVTSKPTTLSGYGITDAAPLNSPALTGTPTAPTAATATNSTQIATTAYVKAVVASTSAEPPIHPFITGII